MKKYIYTALLIIAGFTILQAQRMLPKQKGIELNNDSYELVAEEFRLYYTSLSEESTEFSIWISDNFGNEKQLDFQFAGRN